MWTHSQLVAGFRAAGLNAGDLVLVHSALRKLGPVAGGAAGVIEALRETLGPAGTLAIVAHTYQLISPQQPVFHETLTPTNVGVLSNVFRQRPGVVRSLHPTHSVAALGPRAAEFVAGHELCNDGPCSAASPYGRLRDWGGKILLLGVGLECCTFFHGCEQWAGLPGAVSPQSFPAYSVTAAGKIIPVQIHPHYINTWDQYPRLEPHLLAIGALRITQLGDCPLRVLDAKPTADWVVAQLQHDPSLILPAVIPPTPQ